MTKKPVTETPREKIAELSDTRLQALAFRAWRATGSKNPRARERGQKLGPLFRAEIKLRNLGAAAPARQKAAAE